MRDIGLEEFIRRLRAETNAEKRFALFLGAGCSVSSGIPAAGALVRDRWIPRLRDYKAPLRSDLDTWAGEVIKDYESANPARSYGELIDRLFLTPEDRQREIEDLCEGRTPSFGYAVLAQLIALGGGRFNVVLTTNFDDLIADALYLYTEARPLVIYHESLAAFIRPTRTRPLVVKLHGDHRLSPRNTALETQNLEEEIQRHSSMVLHDRGIIFMGYGGADLGILKLLNDLPPEALPFGAYWVHPEEPSGLVRDWLARRRGVWVRSGWFDEVMLLIRDAFDLPHPRADRFARIFQEYQQRFEELSASIQEKPADAVGVQALKKALTDTEALFPDFWRAMSEASRLAKLDPDGAYEVYRKGVAQFPKAAPLLGTFAIFLTDVRKDFNAAEAMYRKALEADPNRVITLRNYAIFLSDAKKDYAAAEQTYQRALEVDANHAATLGSYAAFLAEVRKDYVAAEAMYKRALDADPKRSITLNNYANFLKDVRQDYDAAELMYKRALEVDPKRAITLSNYATFLTLQRKDYDAADLMYKRALEADPHRAATLSNYAHFLSTRRQDHDAAEAFYKRALEADPKRAQTLSYYALFLSDVRHDYDGAGVMYTRALDAEPKNANLRANLARLLLARGKPDGLAVLDQAIALLHEDPHEIVELECAFYVFVHGPEPRRAEALQTAKRLVQSGVRSPGWNLSENVERAQRDGHPDAPWLGKLAAVINGDAEPNVLDPWLPWSGSERR